jgi:protein-L-isoaspartate(D-aspartate) O-methyltransferase
VAKLVMDTQHLRDALIDSLVSSGHIKTTLVEKAFRKVPRELFLPNFTLDEVYSDGSIITKSIGATALSSSTAPSLMSSMIEILDLKKGQKVLEIGTGTGYNAAILSEIVGDPSLIYSIDIDQETVDEAQENLLKSEHLGVNIICGDGSRGFPGGTAFDRIIFTASTKKVPLAINRQLKTGGILVAPIWFNGTQITPAFVKQNDGSLISHVCVLGGFMAMRKDNAPSHHQFLNICTEHQNSFPPQELLRLLKLDPRNTDLSVEIFSEESSSTFAFGDSAAGIIDVKNNSAVLFSPDNRLFVYGSNKCLELLNSIEQKWFKLGRPDISRFEVIDYSLCPALSKNSSDFHFANKKLLVNIKR